MKFFSTIWKRNGPSGTIKDGKSLSGKITAVKGFDGEIKPKNATVTGAVSLHEKFKSIIQEIPFHYRFLSAAVSVFHRLAVKAIAVSGKIIPSVSAAIRTGQKTEATAHKGNILTAKLAIHPQKPVKASAHKGRLAVERTRITMKVKDAIGAYRLILMHFKGIVRMAVKALLISGRGAAAKYHKQVETKGVSDAGTGASVATEAQETIANGNDGQSKSAPAEAVNSGLQVGTTASAVSAFWEPPIYVDGVLLIRQVYKAEKVGKTLEVE